MNVLQDYVDRGKLSRRSITRNGITYDIYCYTKDAFFAFDWDEILISHRGKIYRTDTGVAINNPIPKIFNLDEHESSSYDELIYNMKVHEYEILDKVNGHLVIISPDASSQFKNVLVSTKGSFEALAQQDEELAYRMGIVQTIKRLSLNYTLMFECLAEYDKHLWYEEQKEKYGGRDTLVLLAAVDNNTGEELSYVQLQAMAFHLACPLTHRFEAMKGSDVNLWFEQRGIEGYVVHFPELKRRIKVKTTEYTTLRYLKDISAEKLVNFLYNSGMENMYREFDEEMYPIIDALKVDMVEDWLNKIDKAQVDYKEIHSKRDKKEVALDKTLTSYERQYILAMLAGFLPLDIMERTFDSKSYRKDFKALGKYPNAEAAIQKMFGEKAALLNGIVVV